MKRSKIIGIICAFIALNIVIDGGALILAHRNQVASNTAPSPIPAPTPIKIDQTTAYAQGVKDGEQKAEAYARGLHDAELANAKAKAAAAQDTPAKTTGYTEGAKDALAKVFSAFSEGYQKSQARIAAANASQPQPDPRQAQQARYQKAQADLLMASREDQLAAALIQKYYSENGAFTAREFGNLDEKTKWVVITYVPWALPPELQGTTVTTIYVH